MNVIELNGNLYDALTGAYLRPAASVAPQPAAAPVPVPVVAPVAMPVAVAPAPAEPAKAVVPHRHSTPARHVAAHKPQATKTLMRHAVAAPKSEPKTPIKVQPNLATESAHTEVKAEAAKPAVQPKASVIAVNPQRSQRAMDINRSGMVKRFESQPHKAATTPALAPTPPAPIKPAAPIPLAPPIKALQPQVRPRQDVVAKLERQPQPMATAKAHRVEQFEKFETFEKSEPVEQATAEELQPEADIFEKALAVANSHQQQAPKQPALKSSRKRRRLASIMSSVAVFLLLIGVVAYQNRSSIQLQLASAKAGFAASAPGYKPNGFSLGKISYGPGTIATTYDHDGKSFSVIQKKSNWDSQTLLENFVATSNESYQGYQSNGRTIYVYGEGRATWVNGGIWYQIQAENVLPNDQIVKVASSM